jgi:hypothetical protein
MFQPCEIVTRPLRINDLILRSQNIRPTIRCDINRTTDVAVCVASLRSYSVAMQVSVQWCRHNLPLNLHHKESHVTSIVALLLQGRASEAFKWKRNSSNRTRCFPKINSATDLQFIATWNNFRRFRSQRRLRFGFNIQCLPTKEENLSLDSIYDCSAICLGNLIISLFCKSNM